PRRALGVPVVGRARGGLPPEAGALIGSLAPRDPSLKHVPVHARARRHAALLLGLLAPRTARVPEDLELHQPIDVLGGEAGLIDLDAELLYTARWNRDHSRRSLHWSPNPCQ